MAKYSRAEIVGFVAGGAFLAVFLVVAGWVIATQVTPGRSAAEVAVTIDAAVPAGARIEATHAQVTPRLEQELRATEGLAFMVSLTRGEGVEVILKFKPDIGEAAALASLRKQLARASAALPPVVKLPPAPKIDTNLQRIAHVALTSERLTRAELTGLAERLVKPRVQEVVGVAAVRILGAMREELHVRLDQARLAAWGFSPQQIETALRQNGIESHAEPLERGTIALIVSAAHDPERLERLVVGERQGAPVYLRDLATLRRDARHDGFVARFNGRDAVILEVLKRPEADAGDVSRGLVQRLADILPMAPAGVRYATGYFCARCLAPRAR